MVHVCVQATWPYVRKWWCAPPCNFGITYWIDLENDKLYNLHSYFSLPELKWLFSGNNGIVLLSKRIVWDLYGVNRNILIFLQLQSNLIPGLNLNALGLFPSGAPCMGPSMSSVQPPGAHGGCSSFGVSDHLHVTFSTVVFPHTIPLRTQNWLCFSF